VLQVTAEALVAVAGRGSFIAPKKGALVYGPQCLLYDYVCNFNYQGARAARHAPRARRRTGAPRPRASRGRARAEPCNLHGICQTNNTCFCGNGYASCAPSTGLQPLPGTLYGTYASSAGCETNLVTDVYNCGHCGNVRPRPRHRCTCCPRAARHPAPGAADARAGAAPGVLHHAALLQQRRLQRQHRAAAAAAVRLAAAAARQWQAHAGDANRAVGRGGGRQRWG
jgi:hypothetical protein